MLGMISVIEFYFSANSSISRITATDMLECQTSESSVAASNFKDYARATAFRCYQKSNLLSHISSLIFQLYLKHLVAA